jgi:hypothetical protein
MTPNQDRKTIALLFNPFEYIAGAKSLLLGLAAIVGAGLIGALGHTHFDGVLDAHTGAAAPLWFFLSEGVVDWLCLAVVLLIIGRLISKTSFRTIDMLGTQALARWPALFVSIITLPKAFRTFGQQLAEQILKQVKIELNTTDAIIFFAVVIAMIPLTCWMVYLMYKSYSVSCNVKGGKAIGTFIGGLIVAEILSKLAIFWLLKWI